MSNPNTLSITTEMDAITSGMLTDSDGMEAFRLAGGEAVRAIDELGGVERTGITEVVVRARDRLSESNRVESLKATHLNEFEIGVAIHAYKAKKGQA